MPSLSPFYFFPLTYLFAMRILRFFFHLFHDGRTECGSVGQKGREAVKNVKKREKKGGLGWEKCIASCNYIIDTDCFFHVRKYNSNECESDENIYVCLLWDLIQELPLGSKKHSFPRRRRNATNSRNSNGAAQIYARSRPTKTNICSCLSLARKH